MDQGKVKEMRRHAPKAVRVYGNSQPDRLRRIKSLIQHGTSRFDTGGMITSVTTIVADSLALEDKRWIRDKLDYRV